MNLFSLHTVSKQLKTHRNKVSDIAKALEIPYRSIGASRAFTDEEVAQIAGKLLQQRQESPRRLPKPLRVRSLQAARNRNAAMYVQTHAILQKLEKIDQVLLERLEKLEKEQ